VKAKTPNSRDLRRQRGQGLVEFAVIFPIFVAILFAIIDGSLLLGRYNNVNNSAKEGARLGAAGGDKTEVVDRAKDQAHGRLDTASTDCVDMGDDAVDDVICVQWVSGPNGESPGQHGSSIRVKIKHKYEYLTPLPNWIGDGGITTTVCAIQRLDNSTSPASSDKVPGEDSC
jgi:hypothetical protein